MASTLALLAGNFENLEKNILVIFFGIIILGRMITHHKIDGYENFQKIMEILDGKGKVLIYFVGTPNPEGKNLCPDCNASGPVIYKVFKEFESKTFHFIQVGVGPRDEYFNDNLPFRLDKKIKLREIPTLMLWRTEMLLVGKGECSNEANIRMILDSI